MSMIVRPASVASNPSPARHPRPRPRPRPRPLPAEAWPSWTDEVRWELGPEPDDKPATEGCRGPSGSSGMSDSDGPRPTPKREYTPTPADFAHQLGYKFGEAGCLDGPPTGYGLEEVAAFYRGWLEGNGDFDTYESEYRAELGREDRAALLPTAKLLLRNAELDILARLDALIDDRQAAESVEPIRDADVYRNGGTT